MSRYILGVEAAQDVINIWEYIAPDNVDAADRLIANLFAAFDQLAEMPHLGHEREDLTDRSLLFWLVGSYLIIYRATQPAIEIVAVTRGSRDVPSLLSKRGPR